MGRGAPGGPALVMPGPEPAPRPTLRVVDAMALIVGTVVGAGIFRTPSLVAANAGSEGVALLAWLAGGAISLVGALCYAELAATYPNAGGDYHYLTRAYGSRVGFLFAWARITVIQTGSIAILAFVVGDYASAVMPLGPLSSAIYAALTIALMTALNAIGVRQGTRAQNVLTSAEVLGLLLIVGAGLLLAGPGPAPLEPAGAGSSPAAFGLVMVFVLLTYGGWNEAAYVSAEMGGSRRNIARALVLSIVVVTGLYLLVNLALIRGLGLSAMARSQVVAADLMARSTGEGGARLVSLLIVVAAVTSLNATVFTGARTAYALGRDFRALAFLGRWHPGSGVPLNALLVQGTLALGLVGLGGLMRAGFETMVEYTAPVFWLFFLLTGAAMVVLRRREPEVPRPFRTPLYPLTPLAFCATSAYLLYSSLVYTGAGALVGVAVVAAGALVLAIMQRTPTPERASKESATMRTHRSTIRLLALLLALTVGAAPGLAAAGSTPTEAPPRKDLDVPFVPTPPEVVDAMLEMAKVEKDDVLYDLGSGDGRIVITAARRHGTRGVGIDLDPDRIKEANENAVRAGVTDRVRFILGDIFDAKIGEATVVTLYLLPAVNLKLRPKLLRELRPGTRIVSHNYDMGDWKPEQTRRIKLPEAEHQIYYWVVPERSRSGS